MPLEVGMHVLSRSNCIMSVLDVPDSVGHARDIIPNTRSAHAGDELRSNSTWMAPDSQRKRTHCTTVNSVHGKHEDRTSGLNNLLIEMGRRCSGNGPSGGIFPDGVLGLIKDLTAESVIIFWPLPSSMERTTELINCVRMGRRWSRSPSRKTPTHQLRQATNSVWVNGRDCSSWRTSWKVMALINPRACKPEIIMEAPFIISSGNVGMSLRNPEKVESGRRTSAALRTPLAVISGKFPLGEQTKKAASMRLETSGDGVDV